MVEIGKVIWTTYESSLMFWGPKTNKFIIRVVFAAFFWGFIPPLVLAIRGCHGS